MTKRAANVVAQMVTVECPCGGSGMDTETYGYSIVIGTTRTIVCDRCEAELTLPKTAKIA